VLEIKDFVLEKNSLLYGVVIPDRNESKKELKRSRNYHDAIALFQELSIPYLDLFDSLTLDDYLEVHWNDSGHFKAYELLKDRIDAGDAIPASKE